MRKDVRSFLTSYFLYTLHSADSLLVVTEYCTLYTVNCQQGLRGRSPRDFPPSPSRGKKLEVRGKNLCEKMFAHFLPLIFYIRYIQQTAFWVLLNTVHCTLSTDNRARFIIDYSILLICSTSDCFLSR